VNRKTGPFNKPYGRRSHLAVLQDEQLRLANQALQEARLVVGDFKKAVATAKDGDLVYLVGDPSENRP